METPFVVYDYTGKLCMFYNDYFKNNKKTYEFYCSFKIMLFL